MLRAAVDIDCHDWRLDTEEWVQSGQPFRTIILKTAAAAAAAAAKA